MFWQDTVITESFLTVAGEEYELSCFVHNANSVNITWRINGTVMRSHDKDLMPDVGEIRNKTKSILLLKPECCNDINVSCVASQIPSFDDLESTIVVYTIEKPTIYILDAMGNIVTHLLAVYGGEYNLTCTAVGRPHNITWFIMDVPYWRAVTYNTTNQSSVYIAYSKYTYVPDGQRHQDDVFHISCSTFDERVLRQIRYAINVTNIGIPNLSVSYNAKQLPSVNHFDKEKEHILVCKATGATPEIMLKWIVNNEPFPAFNATTLASRSQLGTYDTIAFLTYKPKNDFDIIICYSEGKYAVQTVFLSTEVRGFDSEGFLFRKQTLSLPVILTFLVLIVCIASIRKYLKSPSSSVENSHGYEYPSGTEDTKLCSTQTCSTNIKGTVQSPSFPLPELPQEEPYNASTKKISVTESEDVYYSRIKNDSQESRVFSMDEVTLVTCLKKGAHIDRWMGVIRCSISSEKSFVLSTKTDSPLYSEEIHWPEYVKKVTELKQNPFVVKVEGICVSSANLYLVQEYLPMATLDKILSSQLVNKGRLCFEHFSYALEVIHGVEFIHSFGFLHPGLSTKKVLLSPDRHCKLYDFVLKEDAPSKVGILKTDICTLNDLPPESLLRNEYKQKSDVWLLAVLSWSLFLNGDQPFAPFGQKKSTSMDIYDHFPKKPTECPSSLFTIFVDAWREDYLSRLSVKEMKDILLSETICFQKDFWKDEGNKTNAQDLYMPMKGV